MHKSGNFVVSLIVLNFLKSYFYLENVCQKLVLRVSNHTDKRTLMAWCVVENCLYRHHAIRQV